MLERYFFKPATVDHIRANVAGAYIEHYVSWLRAQGYRYDTSEDTLLLRSPTEAKVSGPCSPVHS